MPKPRFRQTLATLAAVAGTALAISAETTSFTAPSGYTTITAAAAIDASTPKYSFISHSLARKRQAAAVISNGGIDTLTVTGAGWTANEFAGTNGAHYVVVTSGPTAGDTFDIASNTDETLTLKAGSGDFTAGVNGESITIYQHNTLGSLFGADPTANGVVGGFDPATADQVLLYSNGNFITYFYKNIDDLFNPNDVTDAWVDANDIETDASATVIAANRGFVYLRRDHLAALSIPAFGDVIDSAINVPIMPGFNLSTVPTPVQTNVTLGNSGLAPANPNDPIDLNVHLQAGFDPATAEPIFIWNGTGYSTFFFKNIDDLFNPSDVKGWVNADDTTVEVSSTALEPGCFFVTRKVGNPILNWVFPSVVAP